MIEINYGITGNYYVTSDSKDELIEVCNKIDKSINSTKWHTKHKKFVIRIKDKKTKAKLKEEYDTKVS